MNTDELAQIRNLIDELKNKRDISDTIDHYLKNNNLSIEDTSIQNLFLKDIPYYFNRMIEQLEKEIENPDFIFLPNQSNNNSEFQNSNLILNLRALSQNINAGNLDLAVKNLKLTIWYQRCNGFWDKSEKRIHDVDTLQIKQLMSEANGINKLSKKVFDRITTKFKELDDKKGDLENFKNEKNSQLQSIISNVPIAQTSIQQLNDLLNQGTKIISEINNNLENSKQKLEDLDEDRVDRVKILDELIENISVDSKNYKESFKEFQINIDDFNNKMDSELKTLEILFNDVNSKKEFFDERNKYLTEIIGLEAGASLFKTFEKRKIELNRQVNIWRIFVFSTSALTIAIIFALFYYNGITPNMNPSEIWQKIAMNAIKTLPAFFLMYYSISQYNKERNFQETYAFKSAVALTIKAYRDQLDDPTKKDDLIVESVKNVYRPPIITHTKSENKEINNITDMFKSLIDSIKELIKKVK